MLRQRVSYHCSNNKAEGRLLTDTEAREVAIYVWKTLFPKDTELTALGDEKLLNVCLHLADGIAPLPNSRALADCSQLNYLAPSVWHAIGFLCGYFLKRRRTLLKYRSLKNFNEFFGWQHVFRGQARPWPIRPTSWRSSLQMHERLQKRTLLSEYLKVSTHGEYAHFMLKYFGSIDEDSDATAIAQHFGFPTDLVDFTFDPRV